VDAPQTYVVEAHGARIQIRTRGDVASALARVLPPDTAIRAAGRDERVDADAADRRFELQRPTPSDVGRVWCDDEIVASGDDLDALEVVLASEVQLATAVHARDAVFVHAGVVAWRGVGIVVPGRTMTGKSTLVRALVDRGATYYSDEYAVLDAAGRVHPHTTPISIRRRGGRSMLLSPDRAGTDPVPVGLVISTRFEPSARWAPRVSVGAAAAMPLVDNTVVARLEPARMLDAVAAVARVARCLTGPRPEASAIADDLVGVVDELVETRGA
jgi:hypothetical protein